MGALFIIGSSKPRDIIGNRVQSPDAKLFDSTRQNMESLQQLIIDTLERDGKIDDTRNIKLPETLRKDDVQEAQMIIQGALNSLLSREVGACAQNYP